MQKIVLLNTLFVTLAFSQINIPDTAQSKCYSNDAQISCPKKGEAFYGQDAQYLSFSPSYKDNGDGTVTDLVTGLIWTKDVDDKKLSLEEAQSKAKSLHVGGHSDWRVPTLKELYSLIDFRGYTGFAKGGSNTNQAPSNVIPFINTDFFDFKYGASDERYIDAQWLSSTKYVSTTMNNQQTLFGVNFADGRIKGYGYRRAESNQDTKKFYVRYVRGTSSYGKNNFEESKEGILLDSVTNLMWTKKDSQKTMNWKESLGYCENLDLGGFNDWRLPNAKELQYIVDYSRSPDTTSSPAIDEKFQLSAIKNEAEQKDWGYYWSSTTHSDGPNPSNAAAYISFGRALGKMRGEVIDVHGAGAQRSDPKEGSLEFRGPQGDAIRSKNFALCVRGGANIQNVQPDSVNAYPNVLHVKQNSQSGYSKNTLNQHTSNATNQAPEQSKFIKRLDKDGDGKISRNEFDGPVQAFGKLDRNHDGYLSYDEAPKGLPMQKR